MGSQKLTLAFDGSTLLERALAAATALPTVIVVSPELLPHVPPAPGRRVAVNAEPERGMTHSLRLANSLIEDPDAPLVVLLADTPFVDARLVASVLTALGDADVAYPVRGEVPGHPVAFGPRARARIAALADGDTLRGLRDAPDLRRVFVPVETDAPFADVDTPDDARRLHARSRPQGPSASPSSLGKGPIKL